MVDFMIGPGRQAVDVKTDAHSMVAHISWESTSLLDHVL